MDLETWKKVMELVFFCKKIYRTDEMEPGKYLVTVFVAPCPILGVGLTYLLPGCWNKAPSCPYTEIAGKGGVTLWHLTKGIFCLNVTLNVQTLIQKNFKKKRKKNYLDICWKKEEFCQYGKVGTLR